MRTKITFKWLEDVDACEDGVEYYKTLGETDLFRLIERGIEDSELDYCNWLIARCMDHKQALRYALYAAESVLHMYEDAYPDDNRPRMAIESVKAVIKRDSRKNREAAHAASTHAYDYSTLSLSCYTAAWSAADAAYHAASVDVAWAARAAARAAYHAAWAAIHAGNATRTIDSQLKYGIIKNGIEIMKGCK